jgi:hypothetical protein
MTVWTTFCPSKVCWEITAVQTQGKSPSSSWLDNKKVIQRSLHTLKQAGIAGIRLVILPNELTQDGKKFDWTAIDTMLTLCQKEKLAVDLCLGPFQYPYYPGIYLPSKLVSQVYDNENALDTNPNLRRYGIGFLQMQLERYGQHPFIEGFHLANEWPDSQNVAGKEQLKKTISEDFMTKAASLIKLSTEKPIRLNTNIDAVYKTKITNTFTNILTIFEDQGYLGFDIYPSQETWRKAFLLKLLRFFIPYRSSLAMIKKHYKLTQIYFAEIEAQPWGDGRSWYKIIINEPDPKKKVLAHSPLSLKKTWEKYLSGSQVPIISLWGSDFWLAAHEMGIAWPLEQVKRFR